MKHFHGLASKDDEHVSYKETEKLLQALGGSIRIVEEGGHFLEEEGFVSFSELQEKCKIYDTIMLERKVSNSNIKSNNNYEILYPNYPIK